MAACVMTFEARDSAAKVVPARFRFNQNTPCKSTKQQRSRRSTSCQTSRWDHQLGLFRVHRSPSPSTHEVSRKQLTAELMEFSKNLKEKNGLQPMKKSPSAPNLVFKNSPRKVKTSSSNRYAGCALLNAELLKRHAISVDNAGYNPQISSRESLDYNKMSESQASMAMDLHIPNKGGAITLKIKDRSDTAQRHQLLRQTKIDDDDNNVDGVKKLTSVGAASGGLRLQSFSKYPDDFVPRKIHSIDHLRMIEELEFRRSPKDFRKISTPNFRKMSLDRIGGGGGGGGGEIRKSERTSLGYRKASLDYRKSPDFRKRDYKKSSGDKSCVPLFDHAIPIELDFRPRADTGETGRKYRHGGKQLYHSRSDDRRRSFDKHRSDSQCSRFSLNAQPQQVTDCSIGSYELKYFTATSLDTDGSRGDVSDDSHTVDIEGNCQSSDGLNESDALLEEPELENLTEVEVETSGDDIDASREGENQEMIENKENN